MALKKEMSEEFIVDFVYQISDYYTKESIRQLLEWYKKLQGI